MKKKEMIPGFVGERIRKFRLQKKMTQKTLGEKVGVKHNTISQYENGTNEVELDMLYKIAQVLDVTINDFFPATHQESSMLAEDIAPYKTERISEYPFLPVYVAAGLPDIVDGIGREDIETIKVPDVLLGRWAGSKSIYFITVNGESMNRVIPNGSIAAVKRVELSELKNGDIVVYSHGPQYSVKRFYAHGNMIAFKPDSHDPAFLDQSFAAVDPEIRIHGKVVMYTTVSD